MHAGVHGLRWLKGIEFCEFGNNRAAAQAFLLVHIVWLVFIGFSIMLGFV